MIISTEKKIPSYLEIKLHLLATVFQFRVLDEAIPKILHNENGENPRMFTVTL